jgi:hypothetical protein
MIKHSEPNRSIREIALGLVLYASWWPLPAAAQPFDIPAPAPMLPLQIMPPPLPDVVTPLLLQQQQDLLLQQLEAQQAQQFALWAQREIDRALQEADQRSERAWTEWNVLETNEAKRIVRLHNRPEARDQAAQSIPLEPIVPDHQWSSALAREGLPTAAEWYSAARDADRVAAGALRAAERATSESQRALEHARSLHPYNPGAAANLLAVSSHLEEHARFQREIVQRTQDLANSDRQMARNPAIVPIVRPLRPEIVFPPGHQVSIAVPIYSPPPVQPRWR